MERAPFGRSHSAFGQVHPAGDRCVSETVVLSIDQGPTRTRAVVYAGAGQARGSGSGPVQYALVARALT